MHFFVNKFNIINLKINYLVLLHKNIDLLACRDANVNLKQWKGKKNLYWKTIYYQIQFKHFIMKDFNLNLRNYNFLRKNQ